MTERSPLVIDAEVRSVAFDDFVSVHPEWSTTEHIDELRAAEYARLDEAGHVYLDYTGGGLYAESQLRDHVEFMAGDVFGNPHSGNPASVNMTHHVEATRAAVLEYFNASPDEYCVVFTHNASGALKLVGESYPFRRGSRYVLTADNHNSVNGIREFAGARQASVFYAPLESEELRIDRQALSGLLNAVDPGDNLFAFPAQSNYSGVKHPLELISEAQALGWDVLLDCAAYAPTSRVDFSEISPDYATFSFYKIFGYPTGLGCLIAKHDKLRKLDRPWFAGGTIQVASVAARDHFMADGPPAFEDGTVNYLTIPAIATGLRHIDSVGIDSIATRVQCLTEWLLDQLGQIRHTNGQPMIRVLGPSQNVARGGTVTMSIFDPNRKPYSGARVEELAGEEHLSVRTGCFCNPGAGEAAMGLDPDFMWSLFHGPLDLGFQELATKVREETGTEVSAIRVSVGIATNFADVYYLTQFLESLRDCSVAELGEAGDELHLRDSA